MGVAILRALSESGQVTARDISQAIHNGATKQQRQRVHDGLREMLNYRLVAVDNTTFPALWNRTPLGTEALQRSTEPIHEPSTA